MFNPNLVDFMEVQGAEGRSISFTMTGDPPTQERHRFAFRRAPATNFRHMPHMYDPSGTKKTRYATMVREAMVNYGLTHNYFSVDDPITLEVVFVLPRRKQDLRRQGGMPILAEGAQTFPRGKDLDNMIKFLMDALQGDLFHNDVTITKVIVSKMFAQTIQERGWTTVQLSTSNEVPPLAPGVWA
jgi:Holliday junction resolvase RusA-like endonuclease